MSLVGIRFMRKLQYLKKKLLEWNNSTFGRLNVKKSKIWNDIHELDIQIEQKGCLPRI